MLKRRSFASRHDGRVGGQDLLHQSGARTGKADEKNRWRNRRLRVERQTGYFFPVKPTSVSSHPIQIAFRIAGVEARQRRCQLITLGEGIVSRFGIAQPVKHLTKMIKGTGPFAIGQRLRQNIFIDRPGLFKLLVSPQQTALHQLGIHQIRVPLERFFTGSAGFL